MTYSLYVNNSTTGRNTVLDVSKSADFQPNDNKGWSINGRALTDPGGLAQFRGSIDEIRITGTALGSSKFLIPPIGWAKMNAGQSGHDWGGDDFATTLGPLPRTFIKKIMLCDHTRIGQIALCFTDDFTNDAPPEIADLNYTDIDPAKPRPTVNFCEYKQNKNGAAAPVSDKQKTNAYICSYIGEP